MTGLQRGEMPVLCTTALKDSGARTDGLIFELCAESAAACDAARDGGAQRLEVCSRLDLDGLTPSTHLVYYALETRLPTYVLLRPQPDHFIFERGTFQRMQQTVAGLRTSGVAGFVAGILRSDLSVDVEHMQELVAAAHPLTVDFHRAFDCVAHRPEALEAVIQSGCARLLTSGGAADVLRGAQTLERLHRQSAGRITIAAGGGLTLGNAAALRDSWSGSHYHGSLGGASDGPDRLAERIATLVQLLRRQP